MGYNIQDKILGKLQEERKPVTIFTINGVPLNGRIMGYDQDVIILNDSGKQKIVYKHAISTIVPESPVDM